MKPLTPSSGTKPPTPRRMRGYYRAVKRRAPWAMEIERHGRGSLAWLLAYHMRDVDWMEELKKPSIFDRLLEPSAEWSGGYLPVPFTLGEE